jgi:phosphoenolpyruvate carboxylase
VDRTRPAAVPLRQLGRLRHGRAHRHRLGAVDRFRLAEKAERLARYVASLEAIDPAHPLLRELRPATAYAAARRNDFAADLSDPAALSVAANRLTANDPRKLLSLSRYVETLEDEAKDAEAGRAVALKTLAAAMRADGLGMGWIHFRVNAKQLHNAIRRRLDPEGELDLSSKGAVVHLRKAIAKVKAAALELRGAGDRGLDRDPPVPGDGANPPAHRRRRADPDARRRVRGAGDGARRALFRQAVRDRRQGRRLAAVRDRAGARARRAVPRCAARRGRVPRLRARARAGVDPERVFDAGRFVGQIPASLAIERLQGRLAEAMDANGLADVAALVFNTHGESMGRGAHPDSLADRLAWPLSPWAGGGSCARASGSSPRSASRAATATCSSPPPSSPWRR